MNSFETQYYTILRRQVLEEIKYLEMNGHAVIPVLEPCMFCTKAANGDYLCARIRQLKDFLKSIKSQKGRPATQGKAYGTPSKYEGMTVSTQMPLMFPNL